MAKSECLFVCLIRSVKMQTANLHDSFVSRIPCLCLQVLIDSRLFSGFQLAFVSEVKEIGGQETKSSFLVSSILCKKIGLLSLSRRKI